jgi:acid phosphatase (class A)
MLGKRKYKIFFGILIAVLLLNVSYLYRLNLKESLKFSTTATWGFDVREEMGLYSKNLTHEKYVFDIPNFPKNTSDITDSEIDYLISLKSIRTPEKIDEIKKEINVTGMFFNSVSLIKYFDSSQYYFGDEFEKYFIEVSTLVLFEKEKFDRVRPHILEPGIDPIIDVPEHPAYPSGHATQAYFAAYYLSSKFPENQKQYFKDAERIAHNREIAGVHYPSDSAAGKILAEQYFAIISKLE